MENSTPTNVQPESSDAQAQLLQLRKLVTSLLVITIVISVTLNAYLFHQYRLSRGALKEVRGQVANMMAEYNQIKPRMDDFVNKIIQYGNTHKDFGPIMVKYNLVTNAIQFTPKAPAPAAPAASTPAAPAAPAAPKK